MIDKEIYKFGWLRDRVNEERYEYANVWAREHTSGPDRLVIAPRTNHVALIRALSEVMKEPFLLLYVLVVPRGEAEPGRYQSVDSLTSEEISELLEKYKTFLEGDGRHNLWIRSADGSMLVYDRHNVFFAYGPLEKFTVVLTSFGLEETADICFPSPHSHHYHEEFDSIARALLDERSWSASPLRTGDENPGE